MNPAPNAPAGNDRSPRHGISRRSFAAAAAHEPDLEPIAARGMRPSGHGIGEHTGRGREGAAGDTVPG